MAMGPRSRWGLAIALLVAGGFVFVAALQRWEREDLPKVPPAPELQPAGTPEVAPLPDVRVDAGDAGRAARRITEGCDPVDESLRYEGWVGSRALAILSWTGMSEDAANLKIPVYVVGIEDGSIGVRFLQFPMRQQYLHIWLGSGHFTSAPESVFLLDPCSATLGPWPVATNVEPTN